MIWPGLTPAFAAGYPGARAVIWAPSLSIFTSSPNARSATTCAVVFESAIARWSSRIRCCSFSPGERMWSAGTSDAPSTRCSAHSRCTSLALRMLTSTKYRPEPGTCGFSPGTVMIGAVGCALSGRNA